MENNLHWSCCACGQDNSEHELSCSNCHKRRWQQLGISQEVALLLVGMNYGVPLRLLRSTA